MLSRFTKIDNQLIKNTIQFLPICDKILERLTDDEVFRFSLIWTNLFQSIKFQIRKLLHQSAVMYYSRYLLIFWQWPPKQRCLFWYQNYWSLARRSKQKKEFVWTSSNHHRLMLMQESAKDLFLDQFVSSTCLMVWLECQSYLWMIPFWSQFFKK